MYIKKPCVLCDSRYVIYAQNRPVYDFTEIPGQKELDTSHQILRLIKYSVVMCYPNVMKFDVYSGTPKCGPFWDCIKVS